MLIILIAIYFVINLFTHKKYLIIIICIITCILLRTDNCCFNKINKSDIYKLEEVKECIFVYQNLNIKDYSKKSYFYKGKFLQRNKSKKAFYKKDTVFIFNNHHKVESNSIYEITGKLFIKKASSDENICKILNFKKIDPVNKIVNSLFNNNNYTQQSQSFLKAFLFGNKTELTSIQRESFKNSGTMHLFAVSGLHIGCLYLALLFMFRFIGLKQSYSMVITMLMLLGYLYLVKFSVSSTRAYIMLSIFVVSKLIGLKSYSLNVVSIAGICLLLLNPYNYFDLGYMLSISVVLSIVWLIQDIKKVHKIWIINALGNINLVNYAAFWGSFIIIAQNFQSIIPVSLVSNMVLIPMVAFIMPLSFILLLILQIPQLNFFTFVLEWLISKLLYLCNLFSNFSWSTFHFDSRTQLFHDKEHFVIVFLIISFGIVHNIYIRLVILPLVFITLLVI